MPIHIPTPSRPSGNCGCCPDPFGCPCDRCPDHTIRRHDVKPPLRVLVEDCDGPLDLEGLVLETNMWAKAKLKKSITPTDAYFQLADGIGFDQVMVGDIIIMDRVRRPEHMLVTGFDEDQKFIQVQRGYNGTPASTWKKGAKMRIFRVLNAPAVTELAFEDHEEMDGTVTKNVLTGSYLVYEWRPEDTCLPGCYWLEFKLLKMKDRQFFLPGGKWIGTVHTDSDGTFYTGEFQTDASVKLSYSVSDQPVDLIKKIHDEVSTVLLTDANFVIPEIPTPGQSRYDLWRYIVHLYPRPEDEQLRFMIWDKVISLGENPQGEYYLIPSNVHWTGAVHQWSDGNWYTGTSHDDGSVYLDVNGVASGPEASYNESGLVSILCDGCISTASIIPSFEATTEADYGCDLGVGVEWVRRFPLNGEGFLIKVTDSPTAEG